MPKNNVVCIGEWKQEEKEEKKIFFGTQCHSMNFNYKVMGRNCKCIDM